MSTLAGLQCKILELRMQVGVPTWIDTKEQGDKLAEVNGVDNLDSWRPNWNELTSEETTSFVVRPDRPD